MKDNKKQSVSTDQAIEHMQKLCKSLGIPFSRAGKKSGTASIRFINKPKQDYIIDLPLAQTKMKKTNREYISEKFEKNETVYLLNDFEDIAMKLIPGKKTYRIIARFKGGGEYSLEKTTNLALETRIGGMIITKDEYNKW